jgi:mono/diheme cytochrome c family protein
MKTIYIYVLLAIAPPFGAQILLSGEEPANTQKIGHILVTNCVHCHGPEAEETQLRIDKLDKNLAEGGDTDLWQEVLNQVASGDMPPQSEQALSDSDRQALLAWIREGLKAAAIARHKSGGRVALRRLTKEEYQYTMGDLLQLPIDFSRDLPPDPVSKDGFLNNGQTLFISPRQIETFIEVARRALDISFDTAQPEISYYYYVASKALRDADWEEWSHLTAMHEAHIESGLAGKPGKSDPNHPKPESFPTGHVGKTDTYYGRSHGGLPIEPISVEQFVEAKNSRAVEFAGVAVEAGFRQMYGMSEWPLRGELLVRVRATGGEGKAQMTVSMGYRSSETVLNLRPMGTVIVGDDEIFEFRARMEDMPILLTGKDKFRAELIAVNNDSVSTPLLLDSVEIIYPAPKVSSIHPVLEETPEETLRKFVPLAWRRPILESEIHGLLELYRKLSETEQNLPDAPGRDPRSSAALRDTLAVVLSSPHFLYVTPPLVPGQENHLNDHELASRVSYFLWSTMPDAELRDLADCGELRQHLSEQVDRMLADPKSQRFVRSFVYQWLDLNGLERVAINPENFPQYTSDLKADSAEETYAFFEHILRHDLPATQLLKSDFVMLNDRMAQHYGVPGVSGSNFRPLQAPVHRGGLLTQASILTANANGVDSHPIKRGTWILRRLLDDPPPPPPPNVPMLNNVEGVAQGLTITQQLEQHRSNAACYDCHQKIDPWGLALENFDAIGLWRDKPVDPSLDEIRERLLGERKDDFAHALTTKLLVFALGRSLEYTDADAVEVLTERFVKSNYRLQGLITDIVHSPTFQTK